MVAVSIHSLVQILDRTVAVSVHGLVRIPARMVAVSIHGLNPGWDGSSLDSWSESVILAGAMAWKCRKYRYVC